MIYEIIEQSTTIEPVTIEEAKKHCRILNNDDDELLQQYIAAGRAYAEGATGRYYAARTITVYVESSDISKNAVLTPTSNGLLACAAITMPKTVTEIKEAFIKTETGNIDISQQLLLQAIGLSNIIYIAAGSLDNYDLTKTPLIIKYESVCAASKRVKQAILLFTGHFYEHRQEVSAENLKTVPFAAFSLLQQERHSAL